jgi:hypothetical protein
LWCHLSTPHRDSNTWLFLLGKRRKKREEKATKDQLESKKRKAPPAKKPPAKKPPAKKVKEVEPEDTTGDAELAASLANKRESGRNKDVKGSKAVRAKALEKLRKVSISRSKFLPPPASSCLNIFVLISLVGAKEGSEERFRRVKFRRRR